jgi:hypothetical protein
MPKREDDVVFTDLFKIDEPRANKQTIEERLAICNKCPFFSKTFRKCRQCGCFMDLKTTLQRAKCPVGHW